MKKEASHTPLTLSTLSKEKQKRTFKKEYELSPLTNKLWPQIPSSSLKSLPPTSYNQHTVKSHRNFIPTTSAIAASNTINPLTSHHRRNDLLPLHPHKPSFSESPSSTRKIRPPYHHTRDSHLRSTSQFRLFNHLEQIHYRIYNLPEITATTYSICGEVQGHFATWLSKLKCWTKSRERVWFTLVTTTVAVRRRGNNLKLIFLLHFAIHSLFICAFSVRFVAKGLVFLSLSILYQVLITLYQVVFGLFYIRLCLN